MLLPIEQMDLIIGPICIDHTFFSKIIGRPLPMECRADQFVIVWLQIALFLLGNKQDDLVIVSRSYNSSREAFYPVVAPPPTQVIAGVERAQANALERDWHGVSGRELTTDLA